MAFIYMIMAVVEAVIWVFYWALVFGMPMLILWRLAHNRRNLARAALWAALGVIWVIPMGVELARDRLLAQWIANLPPAPLLMLDAGSVLVLDGGVLNPETGRVQFAQCTDHEYDTPHCDFSLGAEVALARQSIALSNGAAPIQWQHSIGCNLDQRDNTLSDGLNAYFAAQSICARQREAAPDASQNAPHILLRYETADIPSFPGQPFGQIIATAPNGTTTLTAFKLTRPSFPALWGVHWLPVFAGMVPNWVSTDLRNGKIFDEATMTGHPQGSFQAMVYAQGWNADPSYGPEVLATLDAIFPYDPARTLPALRSNAFYPSRFAIEVACAPEFRARISPDVVNELRRIATQTLVISNDLPRERAAEALESGCGAALAGP